MRRHKDVLVRLFIVFFVSFIFMLVAYAQGNQKMLFPHPVYFVKDPKMQEQSFGLRSNTAGDLIWEGEQSSPFKLTPKPDQLFGAAYYKDQNILVTINKNGRVSLYKKEKDIFLLKNKQDVNYEAKVLTAFFTRVPGLVYLLLADTKEAERLQNSMEQSYPDRYYRITLDDSAKDWHAIPAYESTPAFLTGCYITNNKKIDISLRENKWITLNSPELLDEPFRSGPYDSLAEAIFVFPGNGIICKTKNGWSLHTMGGSLVKWFSTEGIDCIWWENPTFKNTSYFVHARMGPGGDTYKLDIESGNLIKVKN